MRSKLSKVGLLLFYILSTVFCPSGDAKSLGFWFESQDDMDCADYFEAIVDLQESEEYEKVIALVTPLLAKGHLYKEYYEAIGISYYF